MTHTDLHHQLAALCPPWVEWRTDTCRRGRVLVTAVDHRSGQAMHLGPADLEPGPGGAEPAALTQFREAGFLDGDDGAQARLDRERPQPGSGIVWRGADRFVRRCHAAGLHRAFGRGAFAAQAALALVGVGALIVAVRTGDVVLRAHPAQIPVIIVLGLVAVAIHELGHALVTVHHGRSVRLAGVRLHLGSPAFYVESSDALLLDRRQRMAQAAAGPWAEWLVTSLLALALLALPDHSAAATILHRFVIINTFVIATNLLPFVGLDGALLFADAIHEPDLPFRSRTLSHDGDARDRVTLAYSAANAVVATGLLLAAGFFWWELFGNVVLGLWAAGPGGLAVLAVLGGALLAQTVRLAAPTVDGIAAIAARTCNRVVFRIQRRWRVRSILALRSVPEIGVLDESALGILAGRLQRLRFRNGEDPAALGYLTVPSSSKAWTRHARAVVLADDWQQFVAGAG